jgi:hypothetical protein
MLQSSVQEGATMPVRVLIGGMPRLLMEAVSAILVQEPSLAVVARLDRAADLAASVQVLQPDVVVLQEDGALGLGNHAPLFAARNDLKVVAVSGVVGGGALYRMGARPALLPRLSAAQLVHAVRGTRPAGGRRRGSPSR